MALSVLSVTQERNFKYSTETPNGEMVFFVMFEDNMSSPQSPGDYPTTLNMALTAVDPVTSLAIPQFGAQLGTDPIWFPTYVRNVTPTIHKGQNLWWKVVVEYRQSDALEIENEVYEDDPQNTPAIAVWSSTNLKKVIYEDLTVPANGGPYPIANSAGDGLTQLPQIDEAIVTLQVTRRTDAYDPLVVIEKINHLNDAAMTLMGKGPFDKETIKLVSWRGTEKTATVQPTGGAPSYEVTFWEEVRVYQIRKDWRGLALDQGINHKPVSKKIRIQRHGQPAGSNQPLNGLGKTIYDDKGDLIVANTPVARPIIGVGGLAGLKVVSTVIGQPLAFMMFNYHEFTDLDIGDT